MSQTAFSLVILTYNEEDNIARCIKSVPFASEVVVIDSGSTDRTVGIARQLGARVMVESWRGFYKQKLRGTAVAMNDWVLALDADEALSDKLAEELQELMKSEKLNDYDAYDMPRKAYYLNKWIKHSGWYPEPQRRLFNRTRAKWVEGLPYEKVEAKKVGKLKKDLHHWIYRDISDHVSILNRATNYEALKLFEQGKSSGSLSIWVLLKNVFSNYFLKKAYLDGFPGLVIAVTTAFKGFLLKAKLNELKKIKSKS